MSPRNEEQNKQIRDERREQILQAALELFAKKGLAATKINDITTKAGLSYGLVYHYFTSKDEIFTTLVEIALDGSVKVVEDAAQQNLSPLEQLKWLTETILTELAEDGAYSFLIMVQVFTSDAVPDQVKAMVSCASPTAVEKLIPIIMAGQQAGQIVQEDPVKLAVLYFAMIQGIAMQQVQSKQVVSLLNADLLLKLFKA
jgi:AcrR family transcriptional regulator